MKTRQFIALVVFLFAFSFTTSGQTDSCGLRISLLTCGPGEDLYSLFGHTAIRVTDEKNLTDIVFNYGTFDFDDPDFYTKFVRGKLPYSLSTEKFNSFMTSYYYENRSVTEQLLNLSCSEKKKLFDSLKNNALEANRNYKYEFLFDNCTTRAGNIIIANTPGNVSFKRVIPEPAPTFRNLLHEYLNKGDQPWSKFGIDLLLGSLIDRRTTNREAMFLPDYLMKGFDSVNSGGTPVIASKKIILPQNAMTRANNEVPSQKSKTWFTPLLFTSALLILVLGLMAFKKNPVSGAFLVFDPAFFGFLGLLGCLMLFMWFGTDHELCAKNYNLLWASPPHLAAFAGMLLKKTWVKKYFLFFTFFYLTLLILWIFLPQEMPSAAIPVAALAAIRSASRSNKIKR